MLNGIFGRGFASKCKSLIKVIKNRIDVIRRKRSATLKFLKKDIADLLANGLDINAYGRVEGYIAELHFSSCYDFIENCCDFVSKHVSVMQKLSDCPEDCREAVSSLMFAAARFSDLPELRDLRQIFHGRYENSLDLFVNKQLVEDSTSNPSTMETKIKIMNDIASEASIKWDSKAFERSMSKPPMIPKDRPKKYALFHVNGDNHTSNDRKSADPQGDELKVSSKEKLRLATFGNRLDNCKGDNASKRDEVIFTPKSELPVEDKPCHAREEAFEITENIDVPLRQNQEVSAGKSDFWNVKSDFALKTARLSSCSSGNRMERVNGGAKIQDDREKSVRKTDNQVLTKRKPDLNPSNNAASWLKSRDQDLFITDSYADVYSFQNSTRKTHKEGKSKLKPHSKSSIPPPYVKTPSIKSKDSPDCSNIGSSLAGSDSNGVSIDPSVPDKEGQQIIPPMRGHGRETDYYYSNEGSGTPIPTRRSFRRQHLKSASGHTEIGDADETEVARRKPRSKKRDNSRRVLQVLFDDERHKNDEEERIIDRLLMHYSKKPSSSEDGQLRRNSRSYQVHLMRSDVGEVPQKVSRDKSDDISETIPRPVRSISLPRAQTVQSEGTEVYARATSFQSDRSNASRQVHPKLPDYDDLAAHFAAMKGS